MKRVFKESFSTFFSQGISLVLSILLSFILPKFASVTEFGYWQLFILYSSFIGVLFLGYNDGLYLILGGTDFSKINKERLFPQIKLVILSQILFSLILLIYSLLYESQDKNRQLVFISLAFFITIDNSYRLLGFILMATHRIIWYSKIVIIDKILTIVCIGLIFLFQPINIIFVILGYIISHAISLIFIFNKFKGLFNFHLMHLKETLVNIISICSKGIILMISNLVGIFIIGSGRLIIESYWNIDVFAKISLSITLSSFLLFFISQISYVLYPHLRTTEISKQGKVLSDGTIGLTFFSVFCFIFFFPIYFIVEFWLPQYADSLEYLVLLAPIAFFEIKSNLLFITFFKNLCHIKQLLLINLIVLSLALTLYYISANNQSIAGIVGSILCVIILKCYFMQIYLFKRYHLSQNLILFSDLIMAIILLTSYKLSGVPCMFVSYVVFTIIFLFLNKRELKYLVSTLIK